MEIFVNDEAFEIERTESESIGDLLSKADALLEKAGAEVAYHDPHVPTFSEHGVAMSSVALEPAAYDACVIVTDHSAIDYDALIAEAPVVVDLRNATGAKGTAAPNVYKL